MGKTVTEEEMKKIDNEIVYSPKDIEGVWIGRYRGVVNRAINSSTELYKFTEAEKDHYIIEKEHLSVGNKDKLFNEDDREWYSVGGLSNMKYNSKTRTLDSIYVTGEGVDESKINSIAIGKDADFLTTTLTVDLQGESPSHAVKEYKFIRVPESAPSNFEEIDTAEEFIEYTRSLFEL